MKRFPALVALAAIAGAADAAAPRVAREIPAMLQPAPSAPRDDWDVLFADGFESGLAAWTVTDLSGAGATWGDWDCWSTEGSRSAGCAAAGASAIACGEDYPADMKTWMVCGPFSLEGLIAAELQLSLRLTAEPRFDGLFVGASADGIDFTGTWLTESTEGSYALELSGHLGDTDVWIGFLFFSDGSGARPSGAQIDAVALRGAGPPPFDRYGWSISASETDPSRNRAAILGGVRPLYLWLQCTPGGAVGGLTSAELGLEADTGPVLSFTARNGFLNAGDPSSLLLAVGGCPSGPVVAGQILCLEESSGMEVCIGDASTGFNRSFDCAAVPNAYPNEFVGFSSRFEGTVTPCHSDSVCAEEIVVSVEAASWGSIKALYR